MRWLRPKSLSSVMLLGLALAAVPLVVAVLYAAVQMRQLANTSQELVLRGVEATRSSQVLLSTIASLERTARLYQVLGDRKLLEGYVQSDERLRATREQLARQFEGTEAAANLALVQRLQQVLREGIQNTVPGTPEYDALLGQFDRLNAAANVVAESGSRRLDADLTALRRAADASRQRLFMQSAVLLPLTLLVVFVVTFWISRPLRQIDRAIGQLGQGAFSQPIVVSGPLTSSAWDGSSSGCACACSSWRRRGTDSCDICHMNSRRRLRTLEKEPTCSWTAR
ncbi:MAG: hypothetical protein U1F11_06965 [Steroidobacteraceae bacterium]